MSEPQTKIRTWRYRDWSVPKDDTLCFDAITKDAEQIPEVIKHCRNPHLAIQAGGNVGVYATCLSAKFHQVLTWEPSPENFLCLRENTTCADYTFDNIFAFHAFLDANPSQRRPLELAEANNCGTYRVGHPGGASPLAAPAMRLDDLHLDRCDLIWLDIEGYELFALKGAERTIARHKPVIAVEVKDHCRRYGYSEADLCGWILAQGYTYAALVKDDRVFVPREKP